MNPFSGPEPRAVSHDRVAEFKDVFSMIDPAGDGVLSVDSVKTFILTVAPNISDEEFHDLLKECNVDRSDALTFAQVFLLCNKATSVASLTVTLHEIQTEAPGLLELFALFDPKRTGFIDVDTFLALLMEKGENFSADEAEEMRVRLETMGWLRRGKVNYLSFARSLLSDIDPGMM